MLVAKRTHFPHTITWEKFAATVEERTHKKIWKVVRLLKEYAEE